MSRALHLTGDADADRLLSEDSFALLIGMLLDQQISMEKAFAGPRALADRLGGLDPHDIAAADPESFAATCAEQPAIHRFPGSMAKRIQTLAQYLVQHHDGSTEGLWADADGRELLRRLKALPGFGDQKARIFVALLGKQWGVRPDGWREAAGAYGETDARRSIADVVDQRTLEEVRAWKKEQKAAAKAAKS